METKNTLSNARFLTELALLVAIVILMAFTPIGYISTPVLSVTLITIPVAVAAIILGPKGGTIVGLAFGLTSCYKAFSAPAGMMGILLGINPAFVAILCIVPRILEGFLCGLIYKGLKKGLKGNFLTYYIAGICCPVLNTILFMGTLVALFYRGYVADKMVELNVSNVFGFVIAMVGVQALIEAGVCGIASGAVSQALSKALHR